jgi:hypothetical protein
VAKSDELKAIKLMNRFQIVRRETQRLWQHFQDGKTSKDVLLQSLADLVTPDAFGNFWTMGKTDGEWYQYSQNQQIWVQGECGYSNEQLDGVNELLKVKGQLDDRMFDPSTPNPYENISANPKILDLLQSVTAEELSSRDRVRAVAKEVSRLLEEERAERRASLHAFLSQKYFHTDF